MFQDTISQEEIKGYQTIFDSYSRWVEAIKSDIIREFTQMGIKVKLQYSKNYESTDASISGTMVGGLIGYKTISKIIRSSTSSYMNMFCKFICTPKSNSHLDIFELHEIDRF